MYIACLLALLASNVISYCMAVLLSCNLYILYTLYASVAGKQTILACMLALLTSKILWLVCQQCWQASHMCLYAHIPSKHNTNICCCS